MTAEHVILKRPMEPPFPDGLEELVVGMGCFWGAERLFWQLPGVWVTAVGYAGGETPDPDYRAVCTGRTGHAEVVRVVHDPQTLPVEALLAHFWSGHDPTQGMRQGNDIGPQYRSLIQYHTVRQQDAAEATRARYQAAMDAAGFGAITTEITPATHFWLAEAYHQQYLAKDPGGYCGLGGTGVPFPD